MSAVRPVYPQQQTFPNQRFAFVQNADTRDVVTNIPYGSTLGPLQPASRTLNSGSEDSPGPTNQTPNGLR